MTGCRAVWSRLVQKLALPIPSSLGPSGSCAAERRSASTQLHQAGEKRAYLYGADEKILGGLNSFYLLVDKPEVYGLPPDPKMPTRNLASGSLFSMLGAVLVGFIGMVSFRNRGARAHEETQP